MLFGGSGQHPPGIAPTARQGRAWRRRSRWLIAVCVVAVLAVWVALAYASPPDPSWIPGIYDDRDYDDIIGMVTDGAGVNDARAPQVVRSPLVDILHSAVATPIPDATAHEETIRGPPTEGLTTPADLPLASPHRTSAASEQSPERSTTGSSPRR